MPTDGNRLYLYEALELRAEYDARIKTLRDCLPETRKNRDRLGLYDNDQHQLRPADDFDVSATRESVRALEHKRRKLNNAIQRANYAHSLSADGENLDLSEALEVRKGLSDRIGELHTQCVQSAYVRVVYKEDRASWSPTTPPTPRAPSSSTRRAGRSAGSTEPCGRPASRWSLTSPTSRNEREDTAGGRGVSASLPATGEVAQDRRL